MSILVETTPNPLAMKFTSPVKIFEGENSLSLHQDDSSDYDILNRLLTLHGVDHVFGYQFFITVIKKNDAEWDNLVPLIVETMRAHGYSGEDSNN